MPTYLSSCYVLVWWVCMLASLQSIAYLSQLQGGLLQFSTAEKEIWIPLAMMPEWCLHSCRMHHSSASLPYRINDTKTVICCCHCIHQCAHSMPTYLSSCCVLLWWVCMLSICCDVSTVLLNEYMELYLRNNVQEGS